MPPAVTVAPETKLVPVMATTVPPAVGPLTGDMELTVGAGSFKVKLEPLFEVKMLALSLLRTMYEKAGSYANDVVPELPSTVNCSVTIVLAPDASCPTREPRATRMRPGVAVLVAATVGNAVPSTMLTYCNFVASYVTDAWTALTRSVPLSSVNLTVTVLPTVNVPLAGLIDRIPTPAAWLASFCLKPK